MLIEQIAEKAGRKFGKTQLGSVLRKVDPAGWIRGTPFGFWMLGILVVTNVAAVSLFLWMFRYHVGGDGLVLDRLTQTAYRCTAPGVAPFCIQIYPPKPGIIREF